MFHPLKMARVMQQTFAFLTIFFVCKLCDYHSSNFSEYLTNPLEGLGEPTMAHKVPSVVAMIVAARGILYMSANSPKLPELS